MQLTEQQKRFFDEFGFLKFPGLLKDRIDAVTEDFEGVFAARGGGHNGLPHDGKTRSCILPFIDNSEGLSGLLDDPRVTGIAEGLLGENWNYLSSDGNYYAGDTQWHPDGQQVHGRYIKIAFYLDPVTRDTGALRVIPGSHHIDRCGERLFSGVLTPDRSYDMDGRDVPAVALETTPGDILVFNHRLLHASYGGSACRRMFTLNLSDHAETEGQVEELRYFINLMARFWIDEYYGPAMVRTASAERRKHMDQVVQHTDELPALVAKAKETMSAPMRA